MRRLTYPIAALPDPYYASFQAMANGNVRALTFRCFEHLLRFVANMPPNSMSTEIRLDYTPNDRVEAAQSRLRGYLIFDTADSTIADAVEARVMGGPLRRLYGLEHTSHGENETDGLRVACDVIRRTDLIEPLHGGRLNVHAPSTYFMVQSFEPASENDYMLVEGNLSHFAERVVISMRAEPTVVSREQAAFTAYMAKLQAINRGLDFDEDDFGDIDPLGTDSGLALPSHNEVRPMREPDPLASDLSGGARRFSETLRRPSLLYHIRVFAEHEATALSVASDVAESAFELGSYRLFTTRAGETPFDTVLAGLSKPGVQTVESLDRLWTAEQAREHRDLARLPHVAPVDELAGAFRLPVASDHSPSCIRMNTDPSSDDKSPDILIGADQDPPISSSGGFPRGLAVSQIVKHLGIFGMSGYGKSTAVMNLLLQLWALGIPFMVLEPVKTEYRTIKTFKDHADPAVRNLARSLQVYTLGDETVSPLRFNPYERPSAISLDEHIERLVSCIRGAMPLEGPLEGLLGEGLEEAFESFPDPKKPPSMADILAGCERCLAAKRYSGETHSDLRGALDVRLGTLVRRVIGRLFQIRQCIPSVKQLLSVPSIIEMDRLTTEHACLTSQFLMGSLREHLRVEPAPDRPVRFVLVVEEAHLLVGKNTDTTLPAGIADPKAHAANEFEHMLAELRGLGVGIVIVDQSPGKLASGVLANTSTKLAFKTVEDDDRTALGATMLFGPTEFEEIARLKTGEAFFMTEAYHRPRRLWTVNLHKKLDLSRPPVNELLVPHIRDDAWYREAERNRRVSELTLLAQEMDQFDKRRVNVIREAAELSARLPLILRTCKAPDVCERKSSQVLSQVRSLRERLMSLYKEFVRMRYRRLTGPDIPSDSPVVDLAPLRARLVSRFEDVMRPGTKSCLQRMDALAGRCRRHTGI